MLPAMLLAPPTPLTRLHAGLDKAVAGSLSMEAPLYSLVPGPVAGANHERLQQLVLGAAQAYDGVATLVGAGRQLRESGELPSRALGALMQFDSIERNWIAVRAYLSGIRDAGVVPGFGADMMWTSLPELVSVTQSTARSLRQSLASAGLGPGRSPRESTASESGAPRSHAPVSVPAQNGTTFAATAGLPLR